MNFKFLSLMTVALAGSVSESLSGTIAEEVIGALYNKMAEWLSETITSMMQYATGISTNFWGNEVIAGFMELSRWVAYAMFFVGIFFVIADYIEDRSANKPVYLSTLVVNIIKGMAFAFLAGYICQYSLLFVESLTGTLTSFILPFDITNFNAMTLITPLAMLLLGIIAAAYFIFQSLKRFGAMLIQAVTAFLYVPAIVRGDAEAIGNWLKRTIAISLTFFLQFVLFHLGLNFLLSGVELIGLALWFSMGSVTKILDRYSIQLGNGGGGGAMYAAMMGMQMVVR